MNPHHAPDMSVIVVIPDRYETIRKTMAHLQAQTVKPRLELVLVAPSAGALEPHLSELAGFCRVQRVEIGKVTSIARAYAAGIRRAGAPIVVFTEDHSFPDPDWAEALIQAHRPARAAVGPAIRNGNPDSLVSWADFFIAYGKWAEPAAAGPVDHLPGHNSSYQRNILLKYAPQLETMLEAESVLHWDLRSKGYQLYLEPAAKTSHLNFARLSSWIPVQFYAGRQFAATRAQNWSWLLRLIFTAGAPLIPLVRLWRIQKYVRRSIQSLPLLLSLMPVLLLGLTLDGLGQMMGYAFGIGNALHKVAEYEFHREQHLKPQI